MACHSLMKSVFLFIRFFSELFLVRLWGIRLVWTIHNLCDHEGAIKGESLINKFLFRLCQQVVVHSSHARLEVMKTFGLSPRGKRKISIIPHGHFIDSYENTLSRKEARKELGIDRKNIVFLFFGMIRPYKGMSQLLSAFRSLSAHNVNLLIVGEPKSEEIQEEILEYSKIDKRIHTYLYKVPPNKIQMYMNASDVAVLPFQNILTSGSVLLSMSFGKAVITPNLSSLKDVLSTKGTFFYNSDDPEGLQRALHQALKADLSVMGSHNLAKAECYGWDEIGEGTLQVYHKCLKG